MKKTTALVVAAAVIAVVGAWAGGYLDALTRPEMIQQQVERAGVWGPLLYIALAMASFVVFMLAPVVWAATGIWSLPLVFAYSFTASLVASVVTYAAARRLGSRWADRIPPRIRRWEEHIKNRPFASIIGLRLLLWANPLVDLFAALSGVTARDYLVATVIGLAGPTAFQVMLGYGGGQLAAVLPWWVWAMALVTGALAWILHRWRSGRVEPALALRPLPLEQRSPDAPLEEP